MRQKVKNDTTHLSTGASLSHERWEGVVMALPLITAVRHLPFKESVIHTALELAHRCSIYGVVRVSNTYMGAKCHCSARTFQRHVLTLEQAHVLRKTVIKKLVKITVGDRVETRLRNEINTYTFTLPWKRPSSPPLPIDKMSRNLPPQEREKKSSVREEIANQQKTLRALTPGSGLWERTREEIARLEGLLGKDKDSERLPTGAVPVPA
jgi:hypothetical protein